MDFDWDIGNMKHLFIDYPERFNTKEEVEAIFSDPNFMVKPSGEVDREQRFTGVGYGLEETLKVVIFVIREDRIRPISCWQAKSKRQKEYDENRKANNGN